MNKVSSILVPVDGSPHSFKSFDYAVYLAECCHARIGLLYVVNLADCLSDLEQVSTGGYIPDELKAAGRVVLNEAKSRLDKVLQCDFFLEIGALAEVIEDFALNNDYELIVMGSRGFGALKEILVGSVSNHVLHHADCPVLLVK